MALRRAVVADAAAIAIGLNAWAALRPKMTEGIAPGWTPEIALNAIQRETVLVWTVSGVIRGFCVGDLSRQRAVDSDVAELTFEIKLLAINPAVASPIASMMDAIKAHAITRGVTRLTGWVRDDSPALAYFLGRSYPTITSQMDDDGHVRYLLDRAVIGTTG